MKRASSEAPGKRSVRKKASLLSQKTIPATPKKTVVNSVAKKSIIAKTTKAAKVSVVKKVKTIVPSAASPYAKLPVVAAKKTEVSGVMQELAAELLPRGLSILSPFRFPVDVHKVMTGTARFGGLTFVVIGALFTLLLFPSVWTTDDILSGGLAPAQVISTTHDTIESTADTNSSAAPAAANTITIGQAEPLRGMVELSVNTTNASRVELYIFTESWQNRAFLGVAEQVAPSVWRYTWNTTSVPSGQNYRISAQIWQHSLHSSKPDLTIHTNYLRVDNTPVAEQVVDTVIETVDQTPLAQLQVPARVTGQAEVVIQVPTANSVSVVLEHISSGTRNILYNATQVRPGEWRVTWSTSNFVNGDYRLSARVRNEYGTYTSGQGTSQVVNVGTVTSPLPTNNDANEPVANVAEVTPSVTLPTISLRQPTNTAVSGTLQLQAYTADAQVTALYFYVRDQASLQSRFIGVGTKQTDRDWSINWYTNNTPNGTYDVFVRAETSVGLVESAPVRMFVQNVAMMREPQIIIEQRQSLISAVNEVVEAAPRLPRSVEEVSPVNPENGIQTPTYEILLAPYRAAIDDELLRLGIAYRNSDHVAQDRIKQRIYELFNNEINSLSAEAQETRRSVLRRDVDKLIASYTSAVDRSTALIRERGRSDLLRDTDGDGISDFDEVTIYNTDPLNPDTDGDGFTDGAEILGGFDPLSDVRETVIVYESPKITGVYREDILTVDSVVPIIESSDQATSTVTSEVMSDAIRVDPSLLITGRGLPFSFVTLYIFSTPVIVTVRTDAEGAWQYRFDQELEDGEHNVYVGITDNAGRIIAKSQPYRFLKEAQAITPLQAASLENMVTAELPQSLLSNNVLYTIASISVVAIGLVLIMLGWRLESRRKESVYSEGDALV